MARNYSFYIAVASCLLAEHLSRLERDTDRKRKKEKVVQAKRTTLSAAFADEGIPVDADLARLLRGLQSEPELLHSVQGLKDLLGGHQSVTSGSVPIRADARTLLVDLAFMNPFSPYELKFSDEEFKKALVSTVSVVGISETVVNSVLETKKAAMKVHRHMSIGKIVLYGLGGAAVLAIAGWVAAPLIGGAIGAAVGLSGAAATSYGLAILGGGSLALGGAGMAGGMWLVTGIGAAVGLVGAGGSSTLLEIGAAAAKAEIIKLQVTYKEVILATQTDIKKAQVAITKLDAQRMQLRELLEREKDMNESNSRRIKDLEEMIDAMGDAIQWMKDTKKTD